jgi:hypothetical protein
MLSSTSPTVARSGCSRPVASHSECSHAKASGEWRASRGPWAAAAVGATSALATQGVVLGLLGDTPTCVRWGHKSAGGWQLASHDRGWVRSSPLLEDAEDVVRVPVALQVHECQVGDFQCHPSRRLPRALGWVPRGFPGAPHPDGLMDCKQQDFLDLKQGSGTVYEYCKRFIYLVQYGSHHIDTDVKKTTLFYKGLCAKIHE